MDITVNELESICSVRQLTKLMHEKKYYRSTSTDPTNGYQIWSFSNTSMDRWDITMSAGLVYTAFKWELCDESPTGEVNSFTYAHTNWT